MAYPERGDERLGRYIVRGFTPGAPGRVPVDLGEVPVEDRAETVRVGER